MYRYFFFSSEQKDEKYISNEGKVNAQNFTPKSFQAMQERPTNQRLVLVALFPKRFVVAPYCFD